MIGILKTSQKVRNIPNIVSNHTDIIAYYKYFKLTFLFTLKYCPSRWDAAFTEESYREWQAKMKFKNAKITKKLFCFPKDMSLILSRNLTFRFYPHFFVRIFENTQWMIKWCNVFF